MARPLTNPRKRPRDKQGWRIPKPGTLSYTIYLHAKWGWKDSSIAKAVGRARGTVQRMRQDIQGMRR